MLALKLKRYSHDHNRSWSAAMAFKRQTFNFKVRMGIYPAQRIQVSARGKMEQGHDLGTIRTGVEFVPRFVGESSQFQGDKVALSQKTFEN